MEHKIFMHIGMPKTGTSSLQKFMAYNREVLKKYGWNYPDAEARFDNEKMGESDRYKNAGFVPYIEAEILHKKEGKIEFELFNENIQSSLKTYNTILSDEGIWIENGQEYMEYLTRRYSDITLIVYLRRQDFEMESWYNESVRGYMNGTESFSKWYGQQMINEENGDIFYKYYNRIMAFEKIVTRENIIVRPYIEDKDFNLYKDFLALIGLEEKHQEFYDVKHINRSMTILDTEVKRILNEMLQKQPAKFEGMLQCEYWNVYESAERTLSPYRFGREERIDILKKYAWQNEKVAERYRNGTALFTDTVEFETAELDQMDVLLHYVKLLEKLLIRSCYRNVYPSLTNIFNIGKKIAVFGAGFMAKQMIEVHGLPAEIIIDNNNRLAGQKLGNIKIVLPNDIMQWKKYFVIIAVEDASEIERQLESFGLKKDMDFIHMDEIL